MAAGNYRSMTPRSSRVHPGEGPGGHTGGSAAAPGALPALPQLDRHLPVLRMYLKGEGEKRHRERGVGRGRRWGRGN